MSVERYARMCVCAMRSLINTVKSQFNTRPVHLVHDLLYVAPHPHANTTRSEADTCHVSVCMRAAFCFDTLTTCYTQYFWASRGPNAQRPPNAW